MVNTLSGSVCAYRKETVKPRFIRIDEVMALLDVTQDEAMDIAHLIRAHQKMEAPETQGKRTVFMILVSSCVFFSAVKVIRLVRFQGRQGGFMSSKAQTREKDYERGLRIADSRKAIGLSQDELAHRVGIGRQAISAIENGGDFKTQTLDNLAIVLGVSVDFIMYGKNEENSELLSEAMDVLSDMDELQIRQCLAMMKAMKSVSVGK